MVVLGAATLGLAACGDAYWIAGEVKGGGTSSGSSGGATGSGGAGTPTPGSGGASGQPACKTDVLGAADACSEVGTMQKQAASACEGAGLVLNGYSPSDDCGSGRSHFLKYTCCGSEPPPPPPPSECTSGSLGKADVCLDVGSLQKEADSICASAGLIVTGVSPYEECGFGLYHSLKYTCCGREPPPPTQCKTKVQGDATSCKPAAAWKEYASEDCAAAGGKLDGYSPSEDCGDGNSRSVKYTCCGIVPPPPPPSSQCTTKVQGDATSCKPAAAWEKYASEDCAAAGGKLTGFSPNEDCGDGSSRSVKYTCCGIAPPPPAGK